MTTPSHGHDHPDHAQPGPASEDGTDSPAAWDRRYADLDQVWSGRPNGALVTEVAGLPAGRALDVGCGEGADAVWLSSQGWQVTALDVSQVALERAAQAAEKAGADVRWVHTGLLEAGLSPGSFDLVSAQYPALLKTPGQDAERTLLSLVAPGGLLLVVHHAMLTLHAHSDDGFDPDSYVQPADVAALLDQDWQLELHQERPRSITGGAGVHHVADIVVRARRLG